MNRLFRTVLNRMMICATLMCVALYVFPVCAVENEPDIQLFLPLLERNSFARKILDVSYSESSHMIIKGKESFLKKDVRLVYDAETRKFREEVKMYRNPKDADTYIVVVETWDGKEATVWNTLVKTNRGYRALGSGMYEYSGRAIIESEPFCGPAPIFISLYYNWISGISKETTPKLTFELVSSSEKTITIETGFSQIEFSKKTGALKRLVSFRDNSSSKDKEKKVLMTHEFSDHIECSGIWIPLRIDKTDIDEYGVVYYKGTFLIDPKKLSLHDKMDDSIFNKSLPVRCGVDDRVSKKNYVVTAVDTLPMNVEAVKKNLEKILEQAQEQKAVVEKKK